VDIEIPEPGGIFNTGPETVPRPAATVILVRGGTEQLEVLLVRRNPKARFMGGVWVFPGGSVDPADAGADDAAGPRALQAAAARELREEAGIELGTGGELIPFARWITPAQMVTRFDTWFFVAAAPPGATPVVDGAEIVDDRWYRPADALAAATRDEIQLVFPTIKQLQRLAGYTTADELLAAARDHEIVTIQPQVVVSDGRAHVTLPDEPLGASGDPAPEPRSEPT
jgi:8-oxo-dGTP pyrophosphatase MutT (NUDIX family)